MKDWKTILKYDVYAFRKPLKVTDKPRIHAIIVQFIGSKTLTDKIGI